MSSPFLPSTFSGIHRSSLYFHEVNPIIFWNQEKLMKKKTEEEQHQLHYLGFSIINWILNETPCEYIFIIKKQTSALWENVFLWRCPPDKPIIKEFRIMGLSINDSVYSCVFFFLTGLHFFHLVVGLLLLSLLSWSCSFSSRAHRNNSKKRKYHWCPS